MKVNVTVTIDKTWVTRHKAYLADASTLAVGKIASDVKSTSRAHVKSSPGRLGRLATAFRVDTFPPRDKNTAKTAVTAYFAKGAGYSGIFETGGTIRPVRGKFLWIATAEAKKLMGGKRITPQMWIAKYGELTPVMSKGVPVLLGTYGVNQRNADRGRGRLLKRGNIRKGYQVQKTPIFFGVRQSVITKKWNLTGVFGKAVAEYPDYMENLLRDKD